MWDKKDAIFRAYLFDKKLNLGYNPETIFEQGEVANFIIELSRKLNKLFF